MRLEEPQECEVDDGSTLIRLLQQAKAAGVRVLLEYSVVPPEEAFTFAPASAVEPPAKCTALTLSQRRRW